MLRKFIYNFILMTVSLAAAIIVPYFAIAALVDTIGFLNAWFTLMGMCVLLMLVMAAVQLTAEEMKGKDDVRN